MGNSFDLTTFVSPLEEWLPWLIGALAAIVVVGCIPFCRRRPRAVIAMPEEAPPPPDPFIFGSAQEKRQAARRKGNPVSVLISDATGRAVPWSGVVADRSLGGLGLMVHNAVPVGTVLSVRPARSSGSTLPWIQVEVRSCRQEGDSWSLGCQYVKVPPSSLLWHFG